MPARPHPTRPSSLQAHQIADAVDEAWHRTHGTGDTHIPTSVLAALALLVPPAHHVDNTATRLAALDTGGFTSLMRYQWSGFVNARPDLTTAAWPLIAPWFDAASPSTTTLRAAHAVATAALRAGLLHLTGTHRRTSTDLFGPVLTVLRKGTDRSARGQFYTPADLTNLIVRITGTPAEHTRVLEPTAGTGGMLRAAAQAMRQQGADPTTVTWVAADTDALAIACLSVNTVLWGLGNHVLLGVADTLTDGWIARAAAARQQCLDLAHDIRTTKAILALLNTFNDRVPRRPVR